MSTNFPTSLDSLSNPISTDTLASVDHASQHTNANDAIEALQAKVGSDGSAVTTSHDYKLSEITGTDKAVGKTAIQTLTNKTLTAPQINMGSDATGDLYYRTSGGLFARLAIGTSAQILQVSSGGIPEWVANPSAADSSTTVKGVVEIATTAEITAGTSLGGTGAKLVVPADAVGTGANKIVQLDSSAKLPAIDGSQLTNIPGNKLAVVTTNVSVDSTEKTVITATVTGGRLGTSNGIVGKFMLTAIDTDASSRDYTVKLKYGATTVATLVLTLQTNGFTRKYPVMFEYVLLASGATNTQEGNLFYHGVLNNGVGTGVPLADIATGTAAEDSTADKTFTVTIQTSNAAATGSITWAYAEYIK